MSGHTVYDLVLSIKEIRLRIITYFLFDDMNIISGYNGRSIFLVNKNFFSDFWTLSKGIDYGEGSLFLWYAEILLSHSYWTPCNEHKSVRKVQKRLILDYYRKGSAIIPLIIEAIKSGAYVPGELSGDWAPRL